MTTDLLPPETIALPEFAAPADEAAALLATNQWTIYPVGRNDPGVAFYSTLGGKAWELSLRVPAVSPARRRNDASNTVAVFTSPATPVTRLPCARARHPGSN